MSEYYIKIDEHTPMLFKALVQYSPYRQKYFAEQLGIQPSNLSAYLNGKKKMSRELADALLELLGISPKTPYIKITNKIKLINK
jgi:plasmid maintenance system antidote protein VapI